MSSTPAAGAVAASEPRRPVSWPLIAAIVTLLVLHAWQSFRLFPSASLLLDREAPVLMVDHALHLYHGALGSRFLLRHGTTWGYDPAFMAGYPETPVWDSSSNLSILFQALAGGGYHPRAYKLGLLLCGILILPLITMSGRVLGAAPGALFWTGLLAWAYFWAALPLSLWLSGLFSFVTASALMILLLGLLARLHRAPGWPIGVAVAVVGIVGFWSHVTAPIIAVGGLVGYLIATWRAHGYRWYLALGGTAVATIVANLTWLVPLWSFRSLRTGTGFFLTSDSVWYFPQYLAFDPVDGRLSLLILLLGLAGLVIWARTGRSVEAWTFAGAAAFLTVLTAAGSLWGPTRVLEPLRFRLPLVLLLALPAGSTVNGAIRSIHGACGRGRRGVAAVVATLGLAAAAVVVLLPETARTAAANLSERRSFVVGFRREMTALVDWLRTETDLSARILFEDQLRLLEWTDPESTHWTPLLPVMLEPETRQFVGGLYHAAFIQHHEAVSFGDYHLAGRPLTDWSPSELESFFETYNIGWAVAWSPVARFILDRIPGARRVGTLPRYATPGRIVPAAEPQWNAIAKRAGGEIANRYVSEGAQSYALYRLDRPHQYALSGSVRFLDARPNRLELRDLRPGPGGDCVLSLHWLDTWHSEPRAPLAPMPVLRDPVPFVSIRLPGPVDRLVLENGYVRPHQGANESAPP